MSALDTAAPLLPGDPHQIGRYALLGRLGAGGMGAVYLGRVGGSNGSSGQVLAAVKVVHRELAADAEFRARFADEVAAARRVAPFCTARVLDADPAADPPYLATEYIDGVPLGVAVTGGGPLDESTLHGVALGVAAALAAIHAAGVVHRDLKPGNVLLSRSGPRVIDFGIARAMDVAARHTLAGTVLGTPGWMAPEQFSGGPVGPAADVFSWGSLVGYAATGRNPWGEEGPPAALAYRIIHQQPDLTGLGGRLRRLVDAALVKDPARRPAACDLVLALVGAGAPTGSAAPAGLGAPAGAGASARHLPPAGRVPRPVPGPTAVIPPRTAVIAPRTAVLPPHVAAFVPGTAPPPQRVADPRRPASVPYQPGPVRRRPRRRWYRKKRYLLPVALVALLLVSSSSGGRKSGGSTSGSGPVRTARPQIGVPVRDGQLEFVLTRWRCGVPEIGQGIWSRRAHGQYCLADLTVHNIGRQSRTLFEPLIKLYDPDGQKHDADVSARFFIGEQSLWSSVDPGQTVSGSAAFDIPESARGDRLELHDGLLSGGTRLLL